MSIKKVVYSIFLIWIIPFSLAQLNYFSIAVNGTEVARYETDKVSFYTPAVTKGNLLPSATDLYDLGSTSYYWRYGYIRDLYSNTICLSGDCISQWPEYINGSGSSNYVAYWVNSTYLGYTDIYYNATTGNVGIGTINPSEKLHVLGNIIAEGIVYSESDPTYDPATELRTWGINKPDGHLYIEWGNGDGLDTLYITDHWDYVSPVVFGTGKITFRTGNGTLGYYKDRMIINSGSNYVNIDIVNASLNLNNNNIVNANTITIADPGYGEGIIWQNSQAKIYVAPLNDSNADGYLQLVNDEGIAFEPGGDGTTSIIFDASGKVGINTTLPDAALTVNGNVSIKNIPQVSDNNKVLTVDANGQITYIDTNSWDKSSSDDVVDSDLIEDVNGRIIQIKQGVTSRYINADKLDGKDWVDIGLCPSGYALQGFDTNGNPVCVGTGGVSTPTYKSGNISDTNTYQTSSDTWVSLVNLTIPETNSRLIRKMSYFAFYKMYPDSTTISASCTAAYFRLRNPVTGVVIAEWNTTTSDTEFLYQYIMDKFSPFLGTQGDITLELQAKVDGTYCYAEVSNQYLEVFYETTLESNRKFVNASSAGPFMTSSDTWVSLVNLTIPETNSRLVDLLAYQFRYKMYPDSTTISASCTAAYFRLRNPVTGVVIAEWNTTDSDVEKLAKYIKTDYVPFLGTQGDITLELQAKVDGTYCYAEVSNVYEEVSYLVLS